MTLDAGTTEKAQSAIAESAPGDRATRAFVIVNADDWGRDRETTNRTLDCIRAGSVSSVSAMVFMADSERAAWLARENGIDTGLHLNLTTPFDAAHCPARMIEQQRRIARYLQSSRFAYGRCFIRAWHPRSAARWRRRSRNMSGSTVQVPRASTAIITCTWPPT